MLNQSIGYSKQLGVVGAIVEFSLLNHSITLMDENGTTYSTFIEDIVVLQEIGKLGDSLVYQHDVLQLPDGQLFEVDFFEEDKNFVALQFLDKNYERVGKHGQPFLPHEIVFLSGTLEFVGNVFELRNQRPAINFDVAIFRSIEDGEVSYFYVGNNKEDEVVDIIEATFFGHQVFDKEFNRITLSHEDFLVEVANGTYKLVQPMELANYIAGVTYGQSNQIQQIVITNDEEMEDAVQDITDLSELASILDLNCACDDLICECETTVEDELFEEEPQPQKVATGNKQIQIQAEVDPTCPTCGELEDECDCELWAK